MADGREELTWLQTGRQSRGAPVLGLRVAELPRQTETDGQREEAEARLESAAEAGGQREEAEAQASSGGGLASIGGWRWLGGLASARTGGRLPPLLLLPGATARPRCFPSGGATRGGAVGPGVRACPWQWRLFLDSSAKLPWQRYSSEVEQAEGFSGCGGRRSSGRGAAAAASEPRARDSRRRTWGGWPRCSLQRAPPPSVTPPSSLCNNEAGAARARGGRSPSPCGRQRPEAPPARCRLFPPSRSLSPSCSRRRPHAFPGGVVHPGQGQDRSPSWSSQDPVQDVVASVFPGYASWRTVSRVPLRLV